MEIDSKLNDIFNYLMQYALHLIANAI